MAFFIPSIQFFFGLRRALFCFGIHFNAILGKHFILNKYKFLCCADRIEPVAGSCEHYN